MAAASQVQVSMDGVPHRVIVTVCVVGATLMQTLDQTIANVALPYMQLKTPLIYQTGPKTSAKSG
jgi:hypothetical protein